MLKNSQNYSPYDPFLTRFKKLGDKCRIRKEEFDGNQKSFFKITPNEFLFHFNTKNWNAIFDAIDTNKVSYGFCPVHFRRTVHFCDRPLSSRTPRNISKTAKMIYLRQKW